MWLSHYIKDIIISTLPPPKKRGAVLEKLKGAYHDAKTPDAAGDTTYTTQPSSYFTAEQVFFCTER